MLVRRLGFLIPWLSEYEMTIWERSMGVPQAVVATLTLTYVSRTGAAAIATPRMLPTTSRLELA